MAGPTASGKTDLAIALAQELGSVIINADSRQIYQGLDIGTAKPTPAQRALVPHHLVDWVPPTATVTVAEYQQAAQALIADYQRRGITPLLVGGSGLYIQAVVQGLKIPPVPPQPQLRQQLATYSQPERYQFLQQVDPASAAKIHPHDAVRTLRALEVYYVTGTPLSQCQGQAPPDYPVLFLYLDSQQLAQRIARRTAQMFAQGLVEETQYLRATYGADLPLLKTLGYREVGLYLDRAIDLEQARALVIHHTRRLAKQQRTWFRAQPGRVHLEADRPDLVPYAWQKVQDFLRAISY
ncbi:MAG: tRNA (adenosine(37)-N6)-dimethylallyltransferase MiaA [Gloeomargarita sp. GMQP_bins_44]